MVGWWLITGATNAYPEKFQHLNFYWHFSLAFDELECGAALVVASGEMDRFLCRFVDSGDGDDDTVENIGRLTIKARYNFGYSLSGRKCICVLKCIVL